MGLGQECHRSEVVFSWFTSGCRIQRGLSLLTLPLTHLVKAVSAGLCQASTFPLLVMGRVAEPSPHSRKWGVTLCLLQGSLSKNWCTHVKTTAATNEYLRGDALKFLLKASPTNFSTRPWISPAASVTVGLSLMVVSLFSSFLLFIPWHFVPPLQLLIC